DAERGVEGAKAIDLPGLQNHQGERHGRHVVTPPALDPQMRQIIKLLRSFSRESRPAFPAAGRTCHGCSSSGEGRIKERACQRSVRASLVPSFVNPPSAWRRNDSSALRSCPARNSKASGDLADPISSSNQHRRPWSFSLPNSSINSWTYSPACG